MINVGFWFFLTAIVGVWAFNTEIRCAVGNEIACASMRVQPTGAPR